MAMRTLTGRLRYAGAAAAAAAVGLSGAAYCDSKDAAPSFDPEALERGAAALREINKSPYAKKVRGSPQFGKRILALSNSVTKSILYSSPP